MCWTILNIIWCNFYTYNTKANEDKGPKHRLAGGGVVKGLRSKDGSTSIGEDQPELVIPFEGNAGDEWLTKFARKFRDFCTRRQG